MKVVKFGGTSLASAEQIMKVCNIVTADPDRKFVVVSAPGKRDKQDTKVTDLLIACADSCIKNGNGFKEMELVIERYTDIAEKLGIYNEVIPSIREDMEYRLKSDVSCGGLFMDLLKASGEDNCAKLVAAYLNKIGYKATYVDPKKAGLLLSNEFGNAQVLSESYDNLKCLKDMEGIVIFPGFFGYSKEGNVVTLPRGGSDITGSILAAAVDADLYENFTDVDSVYVVNPNIVNNPKAISILTYREMRELSYGGFNVFHDEALTPVYYKGIPVCIKNTNNPQAPGTMITCNKKFQPDDKRVVGIAYDTGFMSIYVSKYLMNREIGFGRRLLSILEEEGISYEHLPSGIDNISVILREKQLDQEKESRILDRIKSQLNAEYISVEHNLALIMVVGEGMKDTVGMAARATSALMKAQINIEMINQGSSEVSMMFCVKGEDGEKAVKAMYGEFFT